MHISYPVGDYLIRLKNASLAGRNEVETRKTKLVKAVAETLKKEGFLDDIKEKDGKLKTRLTFRKKEAILLDVKLVSKPGRRVYMNVEELEATKGPAVLVLSTPAGVMSAKDAIKKKVGGEVIAKVY